MTNLSKYGRNANDKTYPDAEESVLGHMVLELGMSPDEAVQNLRPWVRHLDRAAQRSKAIAYGAAIVTVGIGGVSAATIGIGIPAILPFAAAAYNFLIGQQSAQEQVSRNAEYLLLKSCPELLKLVWALTKRGMPKDALVECYDELLGAFTLQYQQRAELGVSDELDHDIVRSFQEIVQRKCEAENLAKSIVAEVQDFTFDTLYQSTDPTAPRVEPNAQPQAIGQNTQLNALPVKAVESNDSIAPIQQAPIAPKKQTALDALLASPYISRAIFGAQRTGKSYLAAIASLNLSDRGTKIYHLNLASFGSEDSQYWQHATKSVRADLPSINDVDEAVTLIEDAIALVIEWFENPNAVLIVDEFAYLGSSSNSYSELLKPLLKIIADKIACLSSTGIKRQQAIWTIAPEFVAGALTQDAKAVKKLQLCYVSIAPNKSVDWNGSRIGFNGELFEQIKNNFPITEAPVGLGSDRICFVDNKWLIVGELPAISPVKSEPSKMAQIIANQVKGTQK